jgi:hypothetical protein
LTSLRSHATLGVFVLWLRAQKLDPRIGKVSEERHLNDCILDHLRDYSSDSPSVYPSGVAIDRA